MAAVAKTRSGIIPPEPDLTPAEMLRRAGEMRQVLRDRQQLCESLGQMPEETHQDFLRAGFYRVLQPRFFGGYENSMTDYVRLLMELSRGCSDSAWVLSMIAARPAAFLCLFSERAQREAYGAIGDCRTAIVVAPRGAAVSVDGGYLVRGEWDYCSGCDISTHFLGHCLLFEADGKTPRGSGFVLFDRPEYTIVDNWNMIGMQGTGSRRVVVENVLVSQYRVLPLTEEQWQSIGDHPGHALYSNPLYHGFPLAPFEFSLDAVTVGCARGALDIYENDLREKRWPIPPYLRRAEMPELQLSFGEAQALIDTAEAALLTLADRYTESCRQAYEKTAPFAAAAARRINRAGEQCVELAWQAMDLMFRTGGSSCGSRSSALGRCFRNFAVLRTHIGTQRDHTSINVARLHFGMPALSGS